jgi:predicted MFS family arabinose efflux permease
MQNEVWVITLIMIAALVVVYFAPALIALNRRHRKRKAIFVLNLLLGWTLIGWIAAIAWSYTDNIESRT